MAIPAVEGREPTLAEIQFEHLTRQVGQRAHELGYDTTLCLELKTRKGKYDPRKDQEVLAAYKMNGIWHVAYEINDGGAVHVQIPHEYPPGHLQQIAPDEILTRIGEILDSPEAKDRTPQAPVNWDDTPRGAHPWS